MSCKYCGEGCDYCDGTAENAIEKVVGYRCTQCKHPVVVRDIAPVGFAPDWQAEPCQSCLDALEEATKTEKDEEWQKYEDKLKDDHAAEIEKLEKAHSEHVDELNDKLREAQAELEHTTYQRDELQAEIERLPRPGETIGDGPCERVGNVLQINADLKTKLNATELLLKDAQQAHIFAKYRADRLSGEDM